MLARGKTRPVLGKKLPKDAQHEFLLSTDLQGTSAVTSHSILISAPMEMECHRREGSGPVSYKEIEPWSKGERIEVTRRASTVLCWRAGLWSLEAHTPSKLSGAFMWKSVTQEHLLLVTKEN